MREMAEGWLTIEMVWGREGEGEVGKWEGETEGGAILLGEQEPDVNPEPWGESKKSLFTLRNGNVFTYFR